MKQSVQLLCVIFDLHFLDTADSPAGNHHGSILTADSKLHSIILDPGDGAIDATDGCSAFL